LNDERCNTEKKEVVIVSTARTPIGAWHGGLSTVPAPQLSALTIKAALERASMYFLIRSYHKFNLFVFPNKNNLQLYYICILRLLILSFFFFLLCRSQARTS
jgi:hypothetical protein